jgi:hypothetical protein
MTPPEQFYSLGDDNVVQRHIRVERERGKKLRKTPWWKTQIQQGVCHFCHQHVGAENLTTITGFPCVASGTRT